MEYLHHFEASKLPPDTRPIEYEERSSRLLQFRSSEARRR